MYTPLWLLNQIGIPTKSYAFYSRWYFLKYAFFHSKHEPAVVNKQNKIQIVSANNDFCEGDLSAYKT